MTQFIYNAFTDEQLEKLAEMLYTKVIDKIKSEQTTLLTQSEAIEYFRISRCTLWRWIREGYIKPKRIGKKLYFIKEQLDNMNNGKGN